MAGQVKIRTLAHLQQVDPRVGAFGPMGLELRRSLTPESAAVHHQEAIAHADLVACVPDDTRRLFERVRNLHSYGVLSYDFYTMAEQLRPFVLEQALGRRFIAYYEGKIPFEDRTGSSTLLHADAFDQIHIAVATSGGSHTKSRRLRVGESNLNFRASLKGLLVWARAAGLLRGQRNRYREDILVEMRNHFAHPTSFSLVSPLESSRAIRRLAEIINHLWGSNTPGGELYPGPVLREVMAVGWRSDREAWTVLRADRLIEQTTKVNWTWQILRAVPEDDLIQYTPDSERTAYPCSILWGPGPLEAARAWFKKEQPIGDLINHLDRLFLVRTIGPKIDPPRRIDAVVSQLGSRDAATWYAICADHPTDALGHVRSVVSNDPESACSAKDECSGCPVATISVGALEEVLRFVG